MKIEKITENKIKIFLNLNDLVLNKIDVHTFMSNPINSQEFFFKILKEAKKEIGFSTENCKLNIEALSSNQENFILTVTKNSLNTYRENKSLKIKRKQNDLSKSIAIYSFDNFDIFCNFCSAIKVSSLKDLKYFSKKTSLYFYKNYYYLVINTINYNYIDKNHFFSMLSEFANIVNNSYLFSCKLTEHGNLIFRNNAIQMCNSYFKK